MGFVGFEEVEMTKTEESLTDLDQVIIKDSFYAQILVLVDSPKILSHRKLSIVRKFGFDDNFDLPNYNLSKILIHRINRCVDYFGFSENLKS